MKNLKEILPFIIKGARFLMFTAVFGVIVSAATDIVRVYLRQDVLPDISGPVSRFVAEVDFETRTVKFDTTFSKATDSPMKITIWRFGDGDVIKSNKSSDISKNELMTHKFEKDGTYNIGYSIIDERDLSDEATCTITFGNKSEVIDEPIFDTNNTDKGEVNMGINADSKGQSIVGYRKVEKITTKQGISDTCGKSVTSYNANIDEDVLNSNRRVIRGAILKGFIALAILAYGLLFVKKQKVSNS